MSWALATMLSLLVFTTTIFLHGGIPFAAAASADGVHNNNNNEEERQLSAPRDDDEFLRGVGAEVHKQAALNRLAAKGIKFGEIEDHDEIALEDLLEIDETLRSYQQNEL